MMLQRRVLISLINIYLQTAFIHPTSILAGTKPKCVIFSELVSGYLFLICRRKVTDVFSGVYEQILHARRDRSRAGVVD